MNSQLEHPMAETAEKSPVPEHPPSQHRLLRWSMGAGLVFATLVTGIPAFAGDALLSWDANVESDLAGYHIHYGTSSGAYTAVVPVGRVTSYTVTALGPGTYYFAITADNTSGSRSAYSNEVSKVIADTASPVISAVAVNAITATSASVIWTTNEAATSLAEYGTTTSYGASSAADPALLTNHSRALNGLLAATTYHYRVISVDLAGNVAVSADYTFTTASAADTTPPVLSNIMSGSVTSTGATITWITNEASTTQIDFGTTSSYGASTTLNASPVTAHSSALTGLQAATVYHFRVRSRDAAGNTAVSGDNTVVTMAAPDTTAPVISGVVPSSTGATSVVITWSTNEPSTSVVDYGLGTGYGASSTNPALVSSHSLSLTGLAASTTYHFRVRSADAAGNTASSADAVFTTTAAPDTTAPVISGVASTSVTSTAATIVWTTNEAGSSRVQYSIDTSFGLASPLSSTLRTSHSVTLSGLAALTQYRYRVMTSDMAGNGATSGTFTFTTTAAPDTTGPAISGLGAGNMTPTSAVITWSTNEPSTSRVEYGLTTAYGQQSVANATLVTSHRETVLNLNAGAVYHLRVESTDGAGNVSRSTDLVVSLPSVADTTPPQDVQMFSATGGTNQVRLTWINPPDADFAGVQIRYRVDRYPMGPTDGQLLGDFAGQPSGPGEAVHEGLIDGVTYYYAAASYDLSGNRQSTMYAAATSGAPSPAVDDGRSPQTGGCGMIIPRDGNPPSGPWQAADLLLMAGVAMYLMRRQLMRRPALRVITSPD